MRDDLMISEERPIRALNEEFQRDIFSKISVNSLDNNMFIQWRNTVTE